MEKKDAWSIAHTLQSDIEYLLAETNSKEIQYPKHALDMMFKHIQRQLEDIKAAILAEREARTT